LQALHFRRRPLSLAAVKSSGDAGRPYRLAFRKLAPLVRLRESLVARLAHTSAWKASLEEGLR
jgi:hypothetical protein